MFCGCSRIASSEDGPVRTPILDYYQWIRALQACIHITDHGRRPTPVNLPAGPRSSMHDDDRRSDVTASPQAAAPHAVGTQRAVRLPASCEPPAPGERGLEQRVWVVGYFNLHCPALGHWLFSLSSPELRGVWYPRPGQFVLLTTSRVPNDPDLRRDRPPWSDSNTPGPCWWRLCGFYRTTATYIASILRCDQAVRYDHTPWETGAQFTRSRTSPRAAMRRAGAIYHRGPLSQRHLLALDSTTL